MTNFMPRTNLRVHQRAYRLANHTLRQGHEQYLFFLNSMQLGTSLPASRTAFEPLTLPVRLSYFHPFNVVFFLLVSKRSNRQTTIYHLYCVRDSHQLSILFTYTFT